jgi:hypothetical protein
LAASAHRSERSPPVRVAWEPEALATAEELALLLEAWAARVAPRSLVQMMEPMTVLPLPVWAAAVLPV